jgi:hypothetical protein
MSIKSLTMTASLLPFVLAADNFPAHAGTYPSANPTTGEPYIPFHLAAEDVSLGAAPVGLLRPTVLAALEGDAAYVFHRDGDKVIAVNFAPDVLAQRREGMIAATAATNARWRAAGMFKDALDGRVKGRRMLRLTTGWRNELYAIYASPRSSALKDAPRTAFGNAAFACERAACAVWGFATFGVHMTGK